MDAAAKGAAAIADKDFPAALTHYTKALIDHPLSPDYFTQRSVAFARLSPPRHDLALKDAEYAVLLGRKRAKREKIQAAQLRRVVALYGVGRYADAKAVLETTARWQPKDSKPAKMEYDMWMARIETKLKTVAEEDKVATETEYPAIELPSEVKMKDWLKSQLSGFSSFQFDGNAQVKDADAPTGTTAASATDTSNDDTKAAESTTAAPPVPAKIRHEWYQSPQNVTITLYAKSVSKAACEIEIQEDSVSVSFPHPANPSSTYTFTLDPLFALIDPTQSKCSVLSTKIELSLKKVQAGHKWHNLEGTAPLKDTSDNQTTIDDAAKAAVLSTLTNTNSTATKPTETAPSYPTSSRTGPKNWDKLADNLTAKSSKTKKSSKDKTRSSESDDPAAKSEFPLSDVDDEGEDDDGYDSEFGGDAVDGFFKKLYAGADDDTRRAMMKSFTESNGTALSTNWKDVGSKRVEEVKSSNE